VIMSQGLSVDPSQTNSIEVVAYNGAGLLASPPLRVEVGAFGALEQRSRMFILSIGVSGYKMADYNLHFAAADAQAFVDTLKIAAKPAFSEIKEYVLVNEHVTKLTLERTVKEIADSIQPNDLFVLFVAGHGSSISGNYYFMQQDLDFSKDQSIQRDAISQDIWQRWIASIQVGKKLLIFDTCESAAAAALVRSTDRVLQTAMEQLQNATGENVIAAARQAAVEGYRQHGVMTSVILEAFEKATQTQTATQVWIDGLANYVGTRVPEITMGIYGFAQEPVRKLSGDNFLIGLKMVEPSSTPDCPTSENFVVLTQEPLRTEANASSTIISTLLPGFKVAVMYFDQWAQLCRDGSKIGYVRAEALAELR
jgi:uncharacterized caspase-like protein